MHITLPRHAALCLFATTAISLTAADWPQWRGPQRDGTSPESGLLQSWPAAGPKLLWNTANLGSGYSTPAIAGERLFLLANEGLENEFAQALSTEDGRKLWSTRLGKVGNPDQQPRFPGARSTPTIDAAFVYVLGSDGDLACLETGTGRVVWQKHLRSDFGGKPGAWAYAESPLVDGDAVICSPGGSQATLLALNKRSGEVLWQCALPEADEAGYASPIVLEIDGTRQIVQLLQKGLVGVEARTGRFLWRYDRAVSRYGANIPSPTAHGNLVYCAAAGTGGGVVRLTRRNGAAVAEEVFFEAKMPSAIGGVVRVGDFLYGTTAQAMLCLEFATGRLKWEERALGAASLAYADGRLYLHGENGEVALVEPTPEGYREHGRFTPPNQPERLAPMERAWTYPAIAHGRLYLRDHAALWCYDLRPDR
jgi:outer membrane protein assembly factor BamB